MSANSDAASSAESTGGSGNDAQYTAKGLGSTQFESLKRSFLASRNKYHEWRKESRICYDFVAGLQWDEKDVADLKAQGRPVITFNRVGSVIDSVGGLEVSNRMEQRFIPRTQGKSGVNELLTSAGKWCRDECNAEDEESDAFLDATICGVGVTETRCDYDMDPEGKLIIKRGDPMEFYPDAAAQSRNLVDARHIFRARRVSTEEAAVLVPGVAVDELHAAWADDIQQDINGPIDATEAPFYRHDLSSDVDKQSRKITLVEAQWWDVERGHRVVDPVSKKSRIMPHKEFLNVANRAAALGIPLTHSEVKRRVYKRAILGSMSVLKEWDGPKEGGFTWKFITGKRDRNKGIWFGLVRPMLDPQRWANKWLSQVLYIINSNAKGGLIAEDTVFENPQEAEDTWAEPGAITIVTEGSLRDGKLKEKEPAAYPEGIDRLMQFAITSIRDVAGVNLELLGMANKDQPGIIENQRKQAGMTILAGFFDSLRHYRKEQGKLMLWFITNFLADGRLIRIGGAENAQYVPLIHDPGLTEYDVIVDDAPSSPNQKEQVWAILVQMAPLLMKMQLPPEILVTMLEYSPLPSSLVAKLRDMVQQGAQQRQQNPEMVKAQAQAQQEQIKAQSAQVGAQAEMMKAILEAKTAQAEAQANQGKMAAENFKTHAEGLKALHDAHATKTGTGTDAIQSLLQALLLAQELKQNEQYPPNKPQPAAPKAA